MKSPAAATPILDHTGIAALLPHRGAMCLIDSVDQWSDEAIVCSSRSHQRRPHPLAREDGSVGAACGVEYAAQAMALHAALAARAADAGGEGGRLPVGMLAGLRALALQAGRLDDIADPLRIEARLESGDPRTALYSFALTAAGRPLASGRATVILDATGLLP